MLSAPKPFFETLHALLDAEGEITLGELLDAAGEQTYGLLTLLLSMPTGAAAANLTLQNGGIPYLLTLANPCLHYLI